MKIALLSDTHNKHHEMTKDLPKADIIIHSGDFSNQGTVPEVASFLDWFAGLDYEHKIFIAGNHDRLFESDKNLAQQMAKDLKSSGVIYLEGTSVKINGYKIWGGPWTKRFFDWAFNCSWDELERFWKQIPEDSDIVVTHGPMYGFGDWVEPDYYHPTGGGHQGDMKLYEAIIKRVRPRLHCCGHIHQSRAVYDIDGSGTIISVNAANLDERYQYKKTRPILVEIEDTVKKVEVSRGNVLYQKKEL